MFVVVLLLGGVGVALILRRLRTTPAAQPGGSYGPADPADADDAPARLLGWAIGLLAADRAEWGQAMLGELDRLDGRAPRWRFAAGCSSAAMVLPPGAGPPPRLGRWLRSRPAPSGCSPSRASTTGWAAASAPG